MIEYDHEKAKKEFIKKYKWIVGLDRVILEGCNGRIVQIMEELGFVLVYDDMMSGKGMEFLRYDVAQKWYDELDHCEYKMVLGSAMRVYEWSDPMKDYVVREDWWYNPDYD